MFFYVTLEIMALPIFLFIVALSNVFTFAVLPSIHTTLSEVARCLPNPVLLAFDMFCECKILQGLLPQYLSKEFQLFFFPEPKEFCFFVLKQNKKLCNLYNLVLKTLHLPIRLSLEHKINLFNSYLGLFHFCCP